MKQVKTLQVLNLIGILAVITVNFLANYLPINDVPTGKVSADYENLFTPAGFTFSIWSVIYLGLISFSVYQFQGFRKDISSKTNTIVSSIGVIFILNCIANIFWLLAWHHYLLQLSLILMIFILTTLIDINGRLRKVDHTRKSYWATVVPFGLYLGWICVATIANFAVYLTSIEWGGFGIAENTWAIALAIVAGLIALFLLHYMQSYPAALAIMWGLLGILFKLSTTSNYRILLITLLTAIVLILYGITRTYRRREYER